MTRNSRGRARSVQSGTMGPRARGKVLLTTTAHTAVLGSNHNYSELQHRRWLVHCGHVSNQHPKQACKRWGQARRTSRHGVVGKQSVDKWTIRGDASHRQHGEQAAEQNAQSTGEPLKQLLANKTPTQFYRAQQHCEHTF